MKNLFKYIFVAAALVISSAAASAQSKKLAEGEGSTSIYDETQRAAIKVTKDVTGPNADGSYTLTLDTYVSGDFVSETTSSSLASDIVLVLDVSGSMYEIMDENSLKPTKDPLNTIKSDYTTKNYYFVDTDGTYMKITGFGSGNTARSGNVSTGTLSTNSQSQVVCRNRPIYEGGISRIEALKESTYDFIDIIADNTYDQVQNRISIVTFAGSASTKKTGVIVNAAGAKELKSVIDGLTPSGGTQTGDGLSNAKSILDAITYDTQKTVILFTDGETNSNKSTVVTTTNAIKAGTNAKNKNVATDKGIATIYTIGAFASASESIEKFLSYNSSNYGSDVRYISGTNYSGTPSKNQDYMFIASAVNQLREAFKKAAGGSLPKGGEGISIPKDKITIKDIVTSQFVLPNGASDVTVKMVPVKVVTVPKTTTADSYVPQWDTPVNAEGVTADVVDSGLTDEEGNPLKSIDVRGFDFSNHWVGLDRTVVDGTQTAAAVHPDGAKLQIKIKIVPDPNDVGGEVKTNDDRSGFYFDDETMPLKNYITPGSVFVPMDMEIKLTGLDADESALFKVYRYNKDADGKDTDEKEYIMTVALTGESSATTVSKLPIVDYITDKTDPALVHEAAITYVVECDSNWSWKYDITPSDATDQGAQHALFKRTSGGVFTSTNKYVFNAVKTPTDGKGTAGKYIYDEANKNNVFNRVNN